MQMHGYWMICKPFQFILIADVRLISMELVSFEMKSVHYKTTKSETQKSGRKKIRLNDIGGLH